MIQRQFFCLVILLPVPQLNKYLGINDVKSNQKTLEHLSARLISVFVFRSAAKKVSGVVDFWVIFLSFMLFCIFKIFYNECILMLFLTNQREWVQGYSLLYVDHK